jgi:hypothetical protein
MPKAKRSRDSSDSSQLESDSGLMPDEEEWGLETTLNISKSKKPRSASKPKVSCAEI